MRYTPFLRNLPPFTTTKPSAKLLERVRRPGYLAKLVRPEDLAPLFKVCARLLECLAMSLTLARSAER